MGAYFGKGTQSNPSNDVQVNPTQTIGVGFGINQVFIIFLILILLVIGCGGCY